MNFEVCFIISYLLSSAFTQDVRNVMQERKCKTSCVLLRNCDLYLEKIRNKEPNMWQFIKENQCGMEEGARLKVCCPEQLFHQNDFFPSKCGNGSINYQSFSDEETQMGEFPFVVALEYKNNVTNHSAIMCSGSLINARYVLTAAHCVDPKRLRNYKLDIIRLGDWNLTSNIDCFESQTGDVCSPPHISAKPEKIILHPMFDVENKYDNDIALIKLDLTIVFSEENEYIQPVCLPPFGIRAKLLSNDTVPFVLEWGLRNYTELSNILLRTELSFLDNALCNDYFSTTLEEKKLCVGGGSINSCTGDSGSPLLLHGPNGPPHLQIGILSYGSSECWKPEIPTVYTSVSYYKNWIMYNMETW